MPWKCPVCGFENPDDADRCLSCGAPRPEEGEALEAQPLAAEAPAEEAPEAAPEPQPAGEAAATAEEAEAQAVEVEEVKAEAAEEAPAEAPAEEAAGAEEAKEEAEAVEAEAPPPPLPEGARVYFKVVNSPAADLRGMTIPLQFEVYGKISIGRSPENVVIAPDPSVSRRHAVVYIEEGRLVIEDLGSTNGTFIYDKKEGVFKKVTKAYLKDGDLVRLGEGTVFQVVIEA